MRLKAYVAGRISRQDEIRHIISCLKGAGIEITRDWTWKPASPITNEQEAAAYRKRAYATLNQKYHEEAEADLTAVLDADVFIILTDEQGSSMYVEMGAAFAGQKFQNKPQIIYAIGPSFDRMVFYQHQGVHRVEKIEEVVEDLKKKGLLG